MRSKILLRGAIAVLFAVPVAVFSQDGFEESLLPQGTVQYTSALETLAAGKGSPSGKGPERLGDPDSERKTDPQVKAALAGVKAASTQKWTGRVHFDFWGYPQTDDGANIAERGSADTRPEDHWSFRRLRFGPAGDLGENMNYKIEMEFAAPNKMAFKDAYLGWKNIPVLQTVQLGNQKRPYGLDHLNSSRYNVYTERPYIVEAFNQDARRFGLLSYGVSGDQAWNWRGGVFLLEDVAMTGKYKAVDGAGDDYQHHQAELASRIANTFVWEDGGRTYAHWALSGSIADPDDSGTEEARFYTRPEARTQKRWLNTGKILGADEYMLFGAEMAFNMGALSIVGEYQSVNMTRNDGLSDLSFDGGYIYVAYWLTGEYTPWSRTSGTLGRTLPITPWDPANGVFSGAWQVSVRYSTADFSDNDIFGGEGNSVSAVVNWWWNSRARVQFSYMHGAIADSKVVAGVYDEQATVHDDDYSIIGVRWMVDF
ncbi:MAG: porin [Planctomycetota bacterium]|nr:porin [Planctomycetota bacterium]